jgi:hypothetical protein
MNPIFLATVQATEEAIVNAMVAAETMKGANDLEVIALPHDRLREALKKYNRLRSGVSIANEIGSRQLFDACRFAVPQFGAQAATASSNPFANRQSGMNLNSAIAMSTSCLSVGALPCSSHKFMWTG